MHAVKLAHGCGLLIPGIIQGQICRIWMNACFWSYFLPSFSALRWKYFAICEIIQVMWFWHREWLIILSADLQEDLPCAQYVLGTGDTAGTLSKFLSWNLKSLLLHCLSLPTSRDRELAFCVLREIASLLSVDQYYGPEKPLTSDNCSFLLKRFYIVFYCGNMYII